MQTVKEALTALQKEPGLINYHSTEPFICLTVAEINIIVSLLSQQSEGVEEDIEAARKFRDYFYENLSEHHNPVVAGYLAGCQHKEQSAGSFGQLSQFIQHRLKVLDNDIENAKAELQSTTDNDVKIMMRDVIKNTIIRIDELEEALRHCGATPSQQQQQQRAYSEADMLSFCEWVANERWREDFLEQRTLTTKDLLDIYNKLPK